MAFLIRPMDGLHSTKKPSLGEFRRRTTQQGSQSNECEAPVPNPFRFDKVVGLSQTPDRFLSEQVSVYGMKDSRAKRNS